MFAVNKYTPRTKRSKESIYHYNHGVNLNIYLSDEYVNWFSMRIF